MVRTCAREHISDIHEARKILYEEIYRYNTKRVHSTTGEIPQIRFERALEKQSMFRPFKPMHPDETMDDVFCYRVKRQVNAYRKIHLNNLLFKISGVPIRMYVECRISLDVKSGYAKLRFWYQGRLVGEQQAKLEDLIGVVQI